MVITSYYKLNVYMSIHGCTYKYRGIQKNTWLFLTILVFTEDYMGVHTNTGAYIGVHNNTGVYRNIYMGLHTNTTTI